MTNSVAIAFDCTIENAVVVSSAKGASLVQLSATQRVINSAGGAVHDLVNLANAATVHVSDYFFV